MKKDIPVQKVSALKLAIVRKYNTDFRTYDWNAYLINIKSEVLEMVLISTHGYDAGKKTAVMRHKIEKMPGNSVAKIEFIPEELLTINNAYKISFFCNNQLFEKNFSIAKNTISEERAKALDFFHGNLGFVFD